MDNFFMIFITLIASTISIICIRYTIRLRNYLKAFIKTSKQISKKEFHSRLNVDVKGELGELSRNFNEMIDIMNSKIEEVEYNHLQMTSILKSISHGILAIDIDGSIMLINEEAKKILRCNEYESIEGKNVNAVIKEGSILKEITAFKGSKESRYIEITTDDEIVYSINLDPIYLQDVDNVIIGSIINIKDITEKVQLENMRTDFVANVSHELKTPLTSISGFVETLKLNENIDVSTRNRFLGIIESESDRLKRLIDDILLLSFIEKKETKCLDLINVYEVFMEVYEMTDYFAKSKNISISYKLDNENIEILSNRDYIKQIFLNLVDNAIKYTPDNKNVWIEIEYENNNLIIKVKDNGVGIPKEDINRIFERFYRVDKARSRDVGGTGLGLAIVKHIVKNLGGYINVKSELGKGSEFTVTIPNKNFLK
ncbi:HAMP domain-containing sensor histidine kinase [Romboutsia sp. 13368]|uniref:HAMP domain-containing sensor histidine kinase n=1 Tax=Romboutsia sp. 13368 TaxID=2708053 RepID=UPI0025E09733|nr:HAMP domain-containing sensor histidine kinase [Romboutsia sp. 13368]